MFGYFYSTIFIVAYLCVCVYRHMLCYICSASVLWLFFEKNTKSIQVHSLTIHSTAASVCEERHKFVAHPVDRDKRYNWVQHVYRYVKIKQVWIDTVVVLVIPDNCKSWHCTWLCNVLHFLHECWVIAFIEPLLLTPKWPWPMAKHTRQKYFQKQPGCKVWEY